MQSPQENPPRRTQNGTREKDPKESKEIEILEKVLIPTLEEKLDEAKKRLNSLKP